MIRNYITCPKCGIEIPVTAGVVNRLGRKSYDVDFAIVCKALQACCGNYSAAARWIFEETRIKVSPGFVQNRIQRAGKTKEDILGPAFAKPCPKNGAKTASKGGLRKDICETGLL